MKIDKWTFAGEFENLKVGPVFAKILVNPSCYDFDSSKRFWRFSIEFCKPEHLEATSYVEGMLDLRGREGSAALIAFSRNNEKIRGWLFHRATPTKVVSCPTLSLDFEVRYNFRLAFVVLQEPKFIQF